MSFWNRFRNTYLSELREHHMYDTKRQRICDDERLKVNDIVVVRDDNVTPRSTWRLARVDKLLRGSDNKVRGAILKTNSKQNKIVTITRPLQKLIPLEVCDEFVTSKQDDSQSRHRRVAAQTGELVRRLALD